MILQYLVEHNRYLNVVGIGVIIALAILFSRNRAAINYRLIINALILQFLIAFFMLKTSLGFYLVSVVASGVDKLYAYAQEGIGFLFGNLTNPALSWGFIFAIRVLPVVIFFGALMSLLFYLGIIQRCVNAVSLLIRPLLRTSGAETLCAIANSFLGQTEAPLVIRNYLCNMTKSEMLVVMVSGMGTISGSILVVFAAMGVPAAHLLSASVMAIPATIMLAKILYPEIEKSATAQGAQAQCEIPARNALDAISQGTSDGLSLALNIGAMLIAFLSLIALLNGFLSLISLSINNILSTMHLDFKVPFLTLDGILSVITAPFSYLLGFTGAEALKVGELLGTKIAVNEMVAYGKMVAMDLSDRTKAIVTYALCGFSNFSCIGIQIGGIGALVPERRGWLSELGLIALFGAVLANLLSAMIAGLLL